MPLSTIYHCPLFSTVHYLPLSTICHCLLFTTVYYLPLSTIYHCPLFHTYYYFTLSTIYHCLLFATVYYFPLSTIYHCPLFHTVYYFPLSTIYHCPLFRTVHYSTLSFPYLAEVKFMLILCFLQIVSSIYTMDNDGINKYNLAIYFQEVGDTSTSGASTHQVAFEIVRQLHLCSHFVLSLCARGVIISCFHQYTSKWADPWSIGA